MSILGIRTPEAYSCSNNIFQFNPAVIKPIFLFLEYSKENIILLNANTLRVLLFDQLNITTYLINV